MLINTYTCAHCKKSFMTDNAWIWCEKNPKPDDGSRDYETTVVRARFCSETCRTNFLVGREWTLNGLLQLVPPEEKEMTAEKKSKAYREAWLEGQEAVRAKPLNSPSNPYDEDEDKDAYEGWNDGATSAGWNDIYTNGVLNKSERQYRQG